VDEPEYSDLNEELNEPEPLTDDEVAAYARAFWLEQRCAELDEDEPTADYVII